MYAKELKVGIKVVPVIKTIEGPLSKSTEWENAQGKQTYLYLVKIVEAGGKKPIYICAMAKTAKTGDKFAAIDLRATDWKGWDSRKVGAKHVSMDVISKNAAAKTGKKVVAKVAPKVVAKKSPAKKVEAKKPLAPFSLETGI